MLLMQSPTKSSSSDRPLSASRSVKTVTAVAKVPSDHQPRLITRLFKSFFSMLIRRKWLILLTTLMISLVGVFSYLVMKPINITISTVMLAGVLLGFFLGSMIAFIREWRNSLLVSREDLQGKTGYPVMGVIPEVKRGERYLAKEIVGEPYSRIAEAYRLTATLMLHGQHNNPDNRVVLITSINVGEGKSVSATNLAYCLADLGAKTLLLDADLRMPSVHFKLGIQNKPGLINYLLEKEELSNITHHVPSMPGLYVITAGSALDFSPVNLLSRNRMFSLLHSAKKYFDYVIIDAPPVTGFADTLVLHSMANSTIVVVPESKAQVNQIRQNLKPLIQIKHSIAGLLKIRAKKDIVDKEYYRDYAKESLQSRIRFKKKQKLNLGKSNG